MLSVVLYVLSIAGINWAFSFAGANFITNSVAGLVFILRDRAQQKIGHWVWAAMALATGLSYLLSDASIALASAVAFGASEAVDWGVYTALKRPWRDRMLVSSFAAAPLDSALFLWLAVFFSPEAFAVMTAAKYGVACVLWIFLRRKTDLQAI